MKNVEMTMGEAIGFAKMLLGNGTQWYNYDEFINHIDRVINILEKVKREYKKFYKSCANNQSK